MNVSCDGDIERPEIQLAAPAKEFYKLGESLLDVQEAGIELFSEGGVYKNYQEEIKQVNFAIGDDKNYCGLIHVTLSDELKLIFKSDRKGFIKLGQSFLNFFSGTVAENDHFHIDYYEGNGLFLPTKISMIFLLSS